VGGRFGVYSNLGPLAGPAAFVEVLTPVPRGARPATRRLALGYLHGDMTMSGASDTTSRIQIDQFPVLAVVRYRLRTAGVLALSAGAGAGVSIAGTRLAPDLSSSGRTVEASAWSIALGGDLEGSVPLRPGQLVLGARYLWVDLGRTSHGDSISGNVAGIMGDLGYRLSF
jgi:hypothetical protein